MTDNILSWAYRDVDSILTQLKAKLPEITNQEWTDLLDSDIGFAVVKTAAYLFNNTSFFSDQNLAEGFISSCTTREAAIRLSKGLGYIPFRATPSSVTVRLTNTPFGYDVNIPPGSSWLIEDVQFVCLQNIFIPAGQTSSIVSLLQGSRYSTTVRYPGQPWFKIVIPTNSSNITVTIDGLVWTPIDSWIDPPVLTSYKLYEDTTGQVVCFGAGLSTVTPTTGQTIEVSAIVTDGLAGNLGTSGLLASMVTNLFVQGVQINQALSGITTTAALGGQDIEGLASIKINAPAIRSTAGRAVTAADYEAILNITPGVGDSKVVGGEDASPLQLGDVIVTTYGTDPVNVSDDFLNYAKAALASKNMLTVGVVMKPPQIIQSFLTIEAGIAGTIINPTTDSVNQISSITGDYILGLRIGKSLFISDLATDLCQIDSVNYVNISTIVKSSTMSQAGAVSIPLITNADLSSVILTLANGTVLFSGDATSMVTAGVLGFASILLAVDALVTATYHPARIGDTVNILVTSNQKITLGGVTINVTPL